MVKATQISRDRPQLCDGLLPLCQPGCGSWRPCRIEPQFRGQPNQVAGHVDVVKRICERSEEHTSELQSHLNLVCRLLLEKKKNKKENTCRSYTMILMCRTHTRATHRPAHSRRRR